MKSNKAIPDADGSKIPIIAGRLVLLSKGNTIFGWY